MMSEDGSVSVGGESEYEYYEEEVDGEEAGLPALGIGLLLIALVGAVVGVVLMTSKDDPAPPAATGGNLPYPTTSTTPDSPSPAPGPTPGDGGPDTVVTPPEAGVNTPGRFLYVMEGKEIWTLDLEAVSRGTYTVAPHATIGGTDTGVEFLTMCGDPGSNPPTLAAVANYRSDPAAALEVSLFNLPTKAGGATATVGSTNGNGTSTETGATDGVNTPFTVGAPAPSECAAGGGGYFFIAPSSTSIRYMKKGAANGGCLTAGGQPSSITIGKGTGATEVVYWMEPGTGGGNTTIKAVGYNPSTFACNNAPAPASLDFAGTLAIQAWPDDSASGLYIRTIDAIYFVAVTTDNNWAVTFGANGPQKMVTIPSYIDTAQPINFFTVDVSGNDRAWMAAGTFAPTAAQVTPVPSPAEWFIGSAIPTSRVNTATGGGDVPDDNDGTAVTTQDGQATTTFALFKMQNPTDTGYGARGQMAAIKGMVVFKTNGNAAGGYVLGAAAVMGAAGTGSVYQNTKKRGSSKSKGLKKAAKKAAATNDRPLVANAEAGHVPAMMRGPNNRPASAGSRASKTSKTSKHSKSSRGSGGKKRRSKASKGSRGRGKSPRASRGSRGSAGKRSHGSRS